MYDEDNEKLNKSTKKMVGFRTKLTSQLFL